MIKDKMVVHIAKLFKFLKGKTLVKIVQVSEEERHKY